jgi:hypothetical protein
LLADFANFSTKTLDAASSSGGVGTLSTITSEGTAARISFGRSALITRTFAAVLEDIGNFFAHKVPIDRHRIGSKKGSTLGEQEKGNVVAQHDGDGISPSNVEGGKAPAALAA